PSSSLSLLFIFPITPPTSIYTLSLHDALPIFRTPEAVLLQAAGQFRALTFASLWSSIASLAGTFALLLVAGPVISLAGILAGEIDRKSTRLNSSHLVISYAVFCLKKKNKA